MLYFVLDLPVSMFASIGYVALGEFVVVSIVGLSCLKYLKKTGCLLKLLRLIKTLKQTLINFN